jgi:molybdate transport system substrate-binding protein
MTHLFVVPALAGTFVLRSLVQAGRARALSVVPALAAAFRLKAVLQTILALALVLCAIPAQGSDPEPARITIFAAASTKAVVDGVAKQFTDSTRIVVEVVPGPSSGLARQIVAGADAHLFLSADQASADYLEREALVDERRNLLTNGLAVVAPADTPLELVRLQDLADARIKRLAIGASKVPAGEYARAALKGAGVLEQVQGKLVEGVDVRATLQFVARGEVEAGIVYRTDILGSSTVRLAFEVDPALHPPIEYPLVLVLRETASAAARKFYDYLFSEKAAQAFRDAQFGIAEP